ncbi:MAG: exonuclease domain-containing protein [Candidatus Zixiibacteriota bacterium]
MRLDELTFVAFDTETTGLWAPSHRLVEIAGVKFRLGDDQVTTFQTLIDPRSAIPAEVISIHGITDEMVAGAPSAKTALMSFFEFCGPEAVLMAHNAPFDIAFVACELDRGDDVLPDNLILDTVDLYRRSYPQLPSYSLLSLVQKFDIEQTQAHRALADAGCVQRLFTRLMDDLGRTSELDELVRKCGQYHFTDGRLREAELPEQFADISLACREQLTLEIVYSSSGRPAETRRIRPLRVFEQRFAIYIRAYCEKAQAERTFRLDRLLTFKLVR